MVILALVCQAVPNQLELHLLQYFLHCVRLSFEFFLKSVLQYDDCDLFINTLHAANKESKWFPVCFVCYFLSSQKAWDVYVALGGLFARLLYKLSALLNNSDCY